MSARVLLGTFAGEQDLVAAACAARAAGLIVADAYAPYPVKGLRPLMGDASSAMARACLGGAVLGALVAVAFQAWASVVSWPLNVGGKPSLSWLTYLPAAFELAVLCAGISTFVAFIVVSGLRPDRHAAILSTGVADDRFVLQIVVSNAAGPASGQAVLLGAGATHVAEYGLPVPDRPVAGAKATSGRLPWVLLWILLGTAALTWVLRTDRSRPNLVFMPEMAVSPAARIYAPGHARRLPVTGTVSRGSSPLHYDATEADALRAAIELRMPEHVGTADDLRWAAPAFAAFCQPCHGEEGHGDGLTIKRGFQPPPSLLTQKARDMKDGQMFHVLTYGQKFMPSQAAQLSANERWRLILHVRRLQARLGVDPPPFASDPLQGPAIK